MTSQMPVVRKPQGAAVGSSSRTRFRPHGALPVLSVLALFGILVWLGLASLNAVPDVVPAEASPLVFSADRAMTCLLYTSPSPRD